MSDSIIIFGRRVFSVSCERCLSGPVIGVGWISAIKAFYILPTCIIFYTKIHYFGRFKLIKTTIEIAVCEESAIRLTRTMVVILLDYAVIRHKSN